MYADDNETNSLHTASYHKKVESELVAYRYKLVDYSAIIVTHLVDSQCMKLGILKGYVQDTWNEIDGKEYIMSIVLREIHIRQK